MTQQSLALPSQVQSFANAYSQLPAPKQEEGRLSFTLFLAIAIHASIIFGLGYEFVAPTLEQGGSVNLRLAIGADTAAGAPPIPTEVTSPANETATSRQNPTVTKPTRAEASTVLATTAVRPETPAALSLRGRDLIEAVAKRDPNNSAARSIYASDSRTRNLTGYQHASSIESAYLAMWRRKCERIGNNNYPASGLEGELVMLVSLLSSGELEEVSILRSSGHVALDQAALATVKRAAPFQPFSVEMRKSYDRLTFTRAWQFSRMGADIDSG